MKNLPLISPGDDVRVRDDLWHVRAVEQGKECQAWTLEGLGHGNVGARLTVLSPFDELVRIERRRYRRVRAPMCYATLLAASARAEPAMSLRGPASAHVTLLPFQRAAAEAVLARGRLRVLIADDVGLGKTLQAGLIAQELRLRHRLQRGLVVVPAGLVEQWRAELERSFGLDLARITWEVLRDRQQRVPHLHPWAHDPLSIVSLDFLRQGEVAHGLRDIDWDLVIVDEAHLATRGSHRLNALALVAERAVHLVLLTATPHSGDAAQFDALQTLGRHVDEEDDMLVLRRVRHARGARAGRRTTHLLVDPHGTERRAYDLLDGYIRAVWREQRGREGRAARLAMLVLRKRAHSGPWPLLQSVRQRIERLGRAPNPAAEQRDLPFDFGAADDAPPAICADAPGLATPSRERAWLGAIAAAVQGALPHDSKLRVLRRLLARTAEPAIVFTEYRDSLQHLWQGLAAGHDVATLHGGLGTEAREHAIRAFVRGRARVLLATDAASEGLNLHHRCRWVIHMELPWSPTRLEQRTGRVDRFGQTRRVHATNLMHRGTAETAVLARLEHRRARVVSALAPSTEGLLLVGTRQAEAGPVQAETMAAVRGVLSASTRLRPVSPPIELAETPPPPDSRDTGAPSQVRLRPDEVSFCELSRRGSWRRRSRTTGAAPPLDLGLYYVMGVPILSSHVVVEDAVVVVHVQLASRAWTRPRQLRNLAGRVAEAIDDRLREAARAHAADRVRAVAEWEAAVGRAWRDRRARVRRLVASRGVQAQSHLFSGTMWSPPEGALRAAGSKDRATGSNDVEQRGDEELGATVEMGTPRLLAVVAVRP